MGARRLMSVVLGLLVSAGCSSTQSAEAQELEIRLGNNSEREQATEQAVRALVEEYPIDQWMFTRTILIDQDEVPHSHPVLTLHTRHLGDDEMLLSTLIHEQFHWFASESAGYAAAIEEFAQMFPEVPDRANGGGNSARSTHLHLIVCHMEYQAMTELLGEAEARALLSRITHYQWVYEKVLNDARVGEVVARHGLAIPGRN